MRKKLSKVLWGPGAVFQKSPWPPEAKKNDPASLTLRRKKTNPNELRSIKGPRAAGKNKKKVDNFLFVYYNSCMIQVNNHTSEPKVDGEVKFSRLVVQLFRKLNLLNRDQKVCYGITLSQCCAIESLEQTGLLSMNELSQHQGVTLSTMTRIVDVLVRDGVLQRISNPGDRRKVCIELTEKGKDLAGELKKCTEAYTKEILEQIPRNRRSQVIESMDLLIKAIETVNPKCCL